MRTTTRRLVLGAGTLLFVLAVGSSVTRTHTPIASRWTYNEQIFPIFRDNCGACHHDGGIAPMSLVTYQSAYPWSQSIREEVLGLRMPPWKAEDGFGDFSNGHSLSATDMDMVLEWSSGGYPQGPRDAQPEPVDYTDEWALGEPSVEVTMPEAFDVDAGTSETVRYFVLPTDLATDQFITGADIMPGAGPIVRDVALYVDTTGNARRLDAADPGPGFGATDEYPIAPPVALWSPGQRLVQQSAVAHALPAGADIVARVHYKKTWITEGQAFSDQSRVGLYLAERRPATLEAMLLTSPAQERALTVDFSQSVDEAIRIVAVLPEVEIDAEDVQVVAVTPDNTRVPLLFLREPDTTWPTRYWFDAPIDLPAGTTIEVSADLHPGARHTPGSSLLGTTSDAPIRLVFDYAPASTLAN